MASSAKREGAEVETPKSSSPKLARNASSKSSKKGLLANGSAGVSSKTLNESAVCLCVGSERERDNEFCQVWAC